MTNVLVYSGPGTSHDWFSRTKQALYDFLGPSYDVMSVSPRQLAQDPWLESTALLVFPGGRDLPYCADLNGEPNKRIRRYVEEGGRYLGICAGAYYASKRVDFEVGTPLEVVGERELAFFPAACYGAVWEGFEYDSEAGARNARISLDRAIWREKAGWDEAPTHAWSYWNGGGAFREIGENEDVQVVGRYADLPDAPAAGVLCKVGEGQALLWGIHPEHDLVLPAPDGVETRDRSLLRSSLALLGLKLAAAAASAPELQPQLLVASSKSLRDDTFKRMRAICNADGLLADGQDRFRISEKSELEADERGIFISPSLHLETDFSPTRYFSSLRSSSHFGQTMLYSPVVTSTQSLLDKNPRLLESLPEGIVSIALRQVAGRGRGANAWVSPAGCLCFSMVIRAQPHLASGIVFAQYLFALSVVDAVRSLSGGEDVGVRLKWPNDIYVDRGASVGDAKERYKKLGGILVNSSYAGGAFTLVIGCGLNTFNSEPTIALCDLLRDRAREELSLERTLAAIVSAFDRLWQEFVTTGATFRPFLDRYTTSWLHQDQEITIAATDQRVRIIGITTDHGLLRTVPSDGSGGFVDLQPDGNSFDMLRGLISVKM